MTPAEVKSLFQKVYVDIAKKFDYYDISTQEDFEKDFDVYWAANGGDILKSINGTVTGMKIKVIPVTNMDTNNPLYNPHKPLIWGDYAGWEGKILKESTNGGFPAYLVKISADGKYFAKMHINKTDIKIMNL